MPKYPTFLSDLADADRKHIRHCVDTLLPWLRNCEGRLRSYADENAEEPFRSSVFKLLHDLNAAGTMIDEMKNELVEKHGLPDDLKQVPGNFRQGLRSVLLGGAERRRGFMDLHLRQLGELDALAGKPIEAFCDIPNIDHSEVAREQYEIGYRATAAELDREGHG